MHYVGVSVLFLNRILSAWIALAVGLVLTMVASLEVKKAIEQDAESEFAFTSDQVTLKIQERLAAYALILKGGASLFAASNSVERREWQAYVEKLRSQDSVSGVQGIGFSQVIAPHQLAEHIARIRAEGFPDYTVRPAGARALYTAIIYLEPFRDRNLRAFGFDMFSEPVRRAAMERARDSGAPALSGKVELVQETGTEVQAGTLMYVPVYRNGATIDTVEQRRAALIGWAYSPYRMKDLLEGILANWDVHKTRRVHLQIYDGLEVKANNHLYDSHAGSHTTDLLFHQRRTINFNGQHWLLTLHAGEAVAPISYASAWATLAGGIVLSSLLCGLLLALARTQARATEIADTLTKEIGLRADLLRESEARLTSLLDETKIQLWVFDGTHYKFFNKQWYDFTGQNPTDGMTIEAWTSVMHPDDLPKASEIWLKHWATKTEHDNFFRLRRYDGVYRDFFCHTLPVRDKNGVFQAFQGFNLDITERKQAEEAVRESAHLVKAIIHFAQEIIVFKDSNFVFRVANPAFCNLVGKTEEEIIGKTDFDLFPGELAEKYRIDDKSVMETGQCKSLDEEIPTDNGPRYLSTTKVLVVGENKAIQGIAIIVRDITERTQSELKLQQLNQQLLTQQQHLVKISRHIPGVIYQYQRWPDGRSAFPYASEGIRAIYGVSPEDVADDATPVFTVVHPDDLEQVAQSIEKSASTLAPWQDQYRVVLPGGKTIWVDGESTPERMPDGGVLWHGYIHEITERKQAEEALRRSEERYRALADHSPAGIFQTDSQGDCTYVNPRWTEITGLTFDEALGQGWSQALHPEDKQRVFDGWYAAATAGSPYDWECRFVTKQGKQTWIVGHTEILFDQQGNRQGYLGIIVDISERKTHEEQLEHVAHFDALTGLPNRALLVDRLHQALALALRRKTMLAVAFLDLDGFKAINDQYGHQAGDHLLTALSGSMKQALREGDTLARIGGDEFVAVLIDLPDVESTAPMLSRLLAAAAEVVNFEGNALRVSASLGVTFCPQAQAIDADQLMRQADQAMYQAKQAGKNRYYIFNTEQDRSVRCHHESLEQIKQALQAREFVLYYQPKVNMRTGLIIGAEALIRWQHPERGLLAPATFLPMIADHPLAIEVGEWVLDTALGQIEHWKRAGLTLPVSVNIDAIHLSQTDFVERLRQRLATHPAVAAGDLELEVLETSALQDIAQVSSVILACHAIGVGFALDDFGTGYSSLTYLKRLPADLLKIDQSFVRDMLDDPDDLAILNGILGLASAFQRKSIAEGVETLEHGEILLQLGCQLAQGYAIARPMPAQDLPVWLATWRAPSSWLNQASISRDDLPILFAWVEHRAWIIKVVSFIQGKRDAAPPLHHEQCRVGQWLVADAQLRKDDQIALESLMRLHIEVHQLASELIRLKLEGQSDAALAQLPELHRLRDRLLTQLLEMLRYVRSEQGLPDDLSPAPPKRHA